MKKSSKKPKNKKKYVLLIAFIAIFIIGLFIGILLKPTKVIEREVPLENEIIGVREIAIKVPAIDDKGNGVILPLQTKIGPGNGLVLVDINNVLAGYDMQFSARTAAAVAEKRSGVNLSNLDIIYSIKTNASIIEGGSAGAAMAITTIALLENKELKPGITITGSINEDGSIGPAGAIVAKSKAAKESNISLFLVPSGYMIEGIEREEQIICTMQENIEYCEVSYAPLRKEVEEVLDITIKEVKDVNEALEYFLTKPLISFKQKVKANNQITDTNFSFSDFSFEGFSKVEISISPFTIYLTHNCSQLVMFTLQGQIDSIRKGFDKKIESRPNSHDLMKSLFTVFKIEILSARIDSFKHDTFYAKLIIKQGDKILILDSRPSDAIAIALRADAPIYVKQSLMEEYGRKVC